MTRLSTGWRWFFSLLLVTSLFSTGCGGEEGNEVVYLNFINAYPGTNSVTVYGPTGPIFVNVPFGEHTMEPIPFNRNLGSELIVSIQGAPETMEYDPELFALYPHETATLMLTRRTDVDMAELVMLRHVQSISPYCRLVFYNGLALDNTGLGNYTFVPGWRFESMTRASHDRQLEDLVIDNLDAALPLYDLQRYKRTELYAQMSAFPYFAWAPVRNFFIDFQGFAGSTEDHTRFSSFVWIGPEESAEIPRVDYYSERVRAHPDTYDFLQCMIEQAIQAMDDDPGAEPPDFTSCNDIADYEVDMAGPGDLEGLFYHFHPSLPHGTNHGNRCDLDMRIFSDFGNIFEGSHGYDGFQDNRRVDLTPEFGSADHFVYVIYGYPVNPRIAAFTVAPPNHGFAEIPGYPGR